MFGAIEVEESIGLPQTRDKGASNVSTMLTIYHGFRASDFLRFVELLMKSRNQTSGSLRVTFILYFVTFSKS